ncbi:phage portal protein [Paenibacillus whitsoniae]|uniref:Phage portal protein n=2 Tax=Paenibacillus whitsoniae TaxID=2496558 RepID=A0A3S0BI38_9BACL|nr:phage portal protein [Paenibacillus whitsoniae]
MSGTFGEVWLESEYVGEAKGLQAKLNIEKEDVPVAGKYATDSKFMGYKGTGSMRLYKTNSRMISKISDMVKQGKNPRFQILSSLNDPAAKGAERVLIKDASFDDLTLIDWELRRNGEVECPFTFTDWEVKDKVEPQ